MINEGSLGIYLELAEKFPRTFDLDAVKRARDFRDQMARVVGDGMRHEPRVSTGTTESGRLYVLLGWREVTSWMAGDLTLLYHTASLEARFCLGTLERIEAREEYRRVGMAETPDGEPIPVPVDTSAIFAGIRHPYTNEVSDDDMMMVWETYRNLSVKHKKF